MDLDKVSGYIERKQITMSGIAKGVVAFSLRQFDPEDGSLTITESGHISIETLDAQIARAQAIIFKLTALKNHIQNLTSGLPVMPIREQR